MTSRELRSKSPTLASNPRDKEWQVPVIGRSPMTDEHTRLEDHKQQGETMTSEGNTVEHPVTGERITFLETSAETNGEYATLELRVRPHGFVVAPHVHPQAGRRREGGTGGGGRNHPRGHGPRLVELGRRGRHR